MPISHCGPGLPGGDTRPPCCPGTTHYLSSVSSVSHLCGEDHGLPWVPIHSPTNFPGQRHLVLSRSQGVGGDAPDATGLMLNAPHLSPLPTCFQLSNRIGLLAVSQAQHAISHLSAFARVISSAWNAFRWKKKSYFLPAHSRSSIKT